MRVRSRYGLLAVLLLMAMRPALPAQGTRDSKADRGAVAASGMASPEIIARMPSPLPGRIPAPVPVPPEIPSLAQLSQAAGAIFSGQVVSISRGPASGHPAVEAVAIRFRVETSIRGATPGQELTIYQWMGLWSGGQRYRVGEHLLVFLYPPSQLGLTSSVGGPLGRFAVDAWGRITLSGPQAAAFRTDPVLGGKSQVNVGNFARAVKRTTGEE